ncbi:hypothetical protein [Pseudonocardia thermophila]|uniref:hypothetical protein n=1 Tax=Pseudonocardia thermophila TaxID=1848 RepID=UPI00190EA4CF|nr:hypothetical protein [Pseudonocardia thermophila]
MTTSTPTGGPEPDEGGDAVCWLNRLCPECGAMPNRGEETCWRCGAPVPDAPPEES